MSQAERADILSRVEGRPREKRRALKELGIPRSTYYRWRQGQPEPKGDRRPCNHTTPNEERRILAVAREFPELSSRQLSAWITDYEGFSASESTVYRLLRKEGLVKRQEEQPVAAKEYHTKTTGPHQMWATDASYFKVAGWGYYYLITVMDDYSRFILAWKLKKDMSADSLIEVVQEAVDATGMTDVPIKDRTKLLSDNGAGYVSRAFRDYLRLVGIGHILAAPFHPQTNGKMERYQQSLKREVNQLPYDLPSQLERAIADFVDYYNHRRYHKALGNVTPADVMYDRREEVLKRREEVRLQTIKRRRDYNRGLKELADATQMDKKCSVEKVSHFAD
jgi:transposase InsO family protein